MLCQYPLVRGDADRSRPRRTQRSQMTAYFFARGGYEHFRVGLKEHLDSFPTVSDETRGRAGRFENARGRREAIASHALAADIQDGTRCGIEGVVFMGVDVAQIPDIFGQRFILPAVPAKDEALLRQTSGNLEEELI